MPLTDTAIRNAKPGDKPVKLFDERGLYIEISPTGGKWWRLKYRFDGKEKRLSLGVYPDVSLKEARNRRDTARKLLTDGIDPGLRELPRIRRPGDEHPFHTQAWVYIWRCAKGQSMPCRKSSRASAPRGATLTVAGRCRAGTA